MKELVNIDDIFSKRIFRIPDYQRGYAWEKKQLIEFWDDLISLSEDRNHYTGVLTIKRIPDQAKAMMDDESWLYKKKYTPFYVVDGQQRLTTISIFLKALIDVAETFASNNEIEPSDILISGETLDEISKKFIFEVEPQHGILKAYKFGYESDNPSFKFLRYQIFGEQNSGEIDETFYTLNLENAKNFFDENLKRVVGVEGLDGLESLYSKIVYQLLFNLYEIDSGFDEFVAFETMNNRGKQLSKLELLKNRLIYISTLYEENEVSVELKRSTRKKINEAWKEIYFQLGRNKTQPLSDDEFLRAHWIMYFKYSRNRGDDYIRFLLDEYFSPKNVFEKVEYSQDNVVEIDELTDYELEEDEGVTEEGQAIRSKRTIKNIDDYVESIRSAAKVWAATYFPNTASIFTKEEQLQMDKINRVKVAYFRPVIMAAILKTKTGDKDRLDLLKGIEQFIFVNLRLCRAQSNYRSSNYYRKARSIYFSESSINDLVDELVSDTQWTNSDDGTFNTNYFKNFIEKKFGPKGCGYYDWADLRYFLYEYEEELRESRNQKKLDWVNFVRSEKDRFSIEHIYPQTPDSTYWEEKFEGTTDQQKSILNKSLGNLLPLSASINSQLQNDDFDTKKEVRLDDKGEKTLRNGYCNGSYSELEVAACDEWTPLQIKERGIRLLNFLERRWGVDLGGNDAKLDLLQLGFMNDQETSFTDLAK